MASCSERVSCFDLKSSAKELNAKMTWDQPHQLLARLTAILVIHGQIRSERAGICLSAMIQCDEAWNQNKQSAEFRYDCYCYLKVDCLIGFLLASPGMGSFFLTAGNDVIAMLEELNLAKKNRNRRTRTQATKQSLVKNRKRMEWVVDGHNSKWWYLTVFMFLERWKTYIYLTYLSLVVDRLVDCKGSLSFVILYYHP